MASKFDFILKKQLDCATRMPPKPVNDPSKEVEKEAGLLSMEELEVRTVTISTNAWACIFFICYLIIGLIYYNYIATIKLGALNTIYLAVVTLATVGYGDEPVGSHAFAACYVLLGAGLVTTLLGMFTGDILDSQESLLKSKFANAAKTMGDMITKTTNKIREDQRKRMQEFLDSTANKDPNDLTSFERVGKQFSSFLLATVHKEDAAKMRLMNMEIYENELRELRWKLVVDVMFLVTGLMIGAVIMMQIEKWSFEDSFYWACVTTTTVGYGDMTPKTEGGKIFCIFYCILGVALVAKGFRDIVTYPLLVRAKQGEMWITKQFEEGLSEKTLSSILSNDMFVRIPGLRREENQLNKCEFVLLMLRMMNKASDKDILMATKLFDQLDSEGDGLLSKDNVEVQLAKARERDHRRALEYLREQHEIDRQRRQSLGGVLGLVDNIADAVTGHRHSITAIDQTPYGGGVAATKRRKSGGYEEVEVVTTNPMQSQTEEDEEYDI